MKMTTFDAVIQALHNEQVRYIVAGGLAVNAHGYVRHTIDIDLVIALDADNIKRAFLALATLGYRPLVPINAEAFSDADNRERWRKEKGMQVLNFHSDAYRGANIDIFVYEPFDFAREYDNALKGQMLSGLIARFVSIPTLIEMKRVAGRARDLDDMHHLHLLREITPDE